MARPLGSPLSYAQRMDWRKERRERNTDGRTELADTRQSQNRKHAIEHTLTLRFEVKSYDVVEMRALEP